MEYVVSILLAGLIAFAIGYRLGYGKHPESAGHIASIWEDAYRVGYDACDQDVREGTLGSRRPS